MAKTKKERTLAIEQLLGLVPGEFTASDLARRFELDSARIYDIARALPERKDGKPHLRPATRGIYKRQPV